VIQKLQENNIGCAVNYRAIHLLNFYKKEFGYKENSFINAEEIGNSCVSLPLYPDLTFGEVDFVIDSLRSMLS
jgi:UDP-4-amino-4-deoxy-L-arabinose-oxoglutarate aminotransferase